MNLEDITRSEISQSQRQKLHNSTYISYIKQLFIETVSRQFTRGWNGVGGRWGAVQFCKMKALKRSFIQQCG